MELVILSGPGILMTPTSHDVHLWMIVGLVCAAILLADEAVTALLLLRNGSSLRWRVSVLLPALLACVSLVYTWQAWHAAVIFPPVPREAGVTGSYCALCNTLNNYATIGEILAAATLLAVLGGVAYLLGKVD